ncbi:MAG: DNA-binding protein [Thermoanaerobaculia bacterium]|nr:hypothetical protein [Anaerolineales bacterium]MCZ7652661.1 DNA-binding protein [Thermoanaerobaculia bacterium]
MELENLLTVKQIVAKTPGLTEGGVRHLIFHADQFGVQKAILRIGRKVLIDRQEFIAWIERSRAA